ncbi:tetratricopeptide repeat protein [bacterium]|nr:tetratricopeptide repeat protein [bacterium]
MILVLFCFCGATRKAGDSFRAGDYREARRLCLEALRSDSTDIDSWILLGRTLAALDSTDRALAVFRSAYRLYPENKKIPVEAASLYLKLASLAESRKDTAAQRSFYTEALRWQPLHPGAIEKLVSLDEAQGKLKAAAERVEILIRHAPDPGPWIAKQNQLESGIRLAQEEYETGRQLLENRDFPGAEAHFEAALRIFSAWPECAYALHWTRGTRLYQEGKSKSLKASIDHFRKASALKPQEPDPYYWIGKAYERVDPNGFDLILEAYRTFLRFESSGPRAGEISERIRSLSEKKKKWDAFWGSGKQR